MKNFSLLLLLPLALPVAAQTNSQSGAPTTKTATSASAAHPHRTTAVAARKKAVAPVCPTVPAALAAPVTPAGLPPATGDVQTAFALRYVDTQIGSGEEAKGGQTVKVQYTGWLASNGEKFDSSLDHGSEPFEFALGGHRVIPGWDQGFQGMKVGGKRRLFIPYQLAYGASGRGPIPAKADLIFDVELISVADASQNMFFPRGPSQPMTPPQPTQPATPPQPAQPQTPPSR